MMGVTFDDVVQGLGREDDDTRGGFARGDWGQRCNDEVMGREMAMAMALLDMKRGERIIGRNAGTGGSSGMRVSAQHAVELLGRCEIRSKS